MKKRKTLVLPLILAVMLLLSLGVQAADSNESLNVEMTKVAGASDFVYDGTDLDSSKTVYHKFKLEKPSRVVMLGATYSNTGNELYARLNGSFTLCNNNKKKLFDIGDYRYHGGDTACACFFLKAGTYYLKGNLSSPYILQLNYKSYSRKVASKKTKAVNIKKSKKVSGYFIYGEKGDHWYKLKLSKKQKMKFTFEGYGSDSIKFTVYGKGKNNSSSVSCYDVTREEKYQTWSGGKLPKGTYYIKVSRNSKKVSGQYSIKWK